MAKGYQTQEDNNVNDKNKEYEDNEKEEEVEDFFIEVKVDKRRSSHMLSDIEHKASTRRINIQGTLATFFGLQERKIKEKTIHDSRRKGDSIHIVSEIEIESAKGLEQKGDCQSSTKQLALSDLQEELVRLCSEEPKEVLFHNLKYVRDHILLCR